MAKKTLFIWMVLAIVLIAGTTSALDFTLDNYELFEKGDLKYGKYEIWDRGQVSEDTKLKEVILEDNSNVCYSKCYAEGTTTIFFEGKLFDELGFQNTDGNWVDINNSKIFLGEEEDYMKNVSIPNTYCDDARNGTNCFTERIITQVPATRMKWTEYKGETLKVGVYKWRIEGTKGEREDVDWIATASGIQMTEFAYWIGTEPTAYYKLNDDVTDSSSNNHDLVARSSLSYIDGKLNRAIDCDGVAECANSTPIADFALGTAPFTILFGINTSSAIASAVIDNLDAGSLTAWKINIWGHANYAGKIAISDAVSASNWNSTARIDDGQWHRIAFVREDSGANGFKIYIDGSLDVSVAPALDNDFSDTGQDFHLASSTGGGSSEPMDLDDIQIFNGLAFSAENITTDYAGGAWREADEIPDDEKPIVHIIYPTNISYNHVVTELNFTASDDVAIDACWYSNDSGETNVTDTSCTIGLNVSGMNYSEGTNTWLIGANDTAGKTNFTTVQFFVDSIIPKISIDYPTNDSSHTSALIDINISVIELNQDSCWWSNSSGTVNNTLTNCGTNITGLTWDEGENVIALWVNDSVGNENSTSVTFVVDTTKPILTFIYPTNTSYSHNVTELNFSVYDASTDACWYSTDLGVTNVTDTSCTIGLNVSGMNFSDGSNNVLIGANDSIGNSNFTTVQFFIDSIFPLIDLTYPLNISYDYVVTTLNYTLTESNLDSCWYSIDIGVTNTTLICGDNVTGLTASQGGNTWMVGINDSIGHINQSITQFTVDSIKPVFKLYKPDKNKSTTTMPVNITLNFTVADTNLDACWWSNNSGKNNHSITCNSVTNVSHSYEGAKTINFWANDTYGNLNGSSVNYWIFYYTYDQNTDYNFVGEGIAVTFNLTLNKTNIPSSTALLMHNNTAYAPTIVTPSTNSYYFEKTLTIPDGTGNATGINVSWWWIYNMSGIALSNATSANNQTIYSVEMDNCTIYNTRILNFTLKDEETNTLMSLTGRTSVVGVDVTLVSPSDSTLTWNYYNEWTNRTTIAVCVPSALLSGSNLYGENLVAWMKTDDYVEEFFYIQNFTITNLTIPKIVPLMELLSADSTSFVTSFTDGTGLKIKDAVISVLRRYVGSGVFREVESGLTDEDAETILHLVEEDVIYQFNVSKYGHHLYITPEYRVYCEVGAICTLDLEEGIVIPDLPVEWDNLPEGTYTVSANGDTRVVTLTWNANESITMNLSVYEYTNSTTTTLVGQEVGTGSSSSVQVTVPTTYGNESFFAVVYKETTYVGSHWIDELQSTGQDYFGKTGIFMLALLVLCLALMAVSEGVGVIVFAILGLIFGYILFLIDAPLIIIMFAITAGILIIIRIMVRRQRG